MAKVMLQKRFASNQANFSKEGEIVDQYQAFNNLIDGIIRDYAKWTSCNYELFATDLDQDILKLFLPYILESDELDDLEEHPHLLKSYIKDHIRYIQQCIDDRCFDVFTQDMEEMGATLCHHKDNGEPYFTRY